MSSQISGREATRVIRITGTADSVLRANKIGGVVSVGPDDTVLKALEVMATHNIGAVVVLDAHQSLVGILSERDYARKVELRGATAGATKVADHDEDDVRWTVLQDVEGNEFCVAGKH